MLIELGNHAAKAELDPLDDRPKITTVHIPEYDDGKNHPDKIPTGGYTHEIGAIKVDDFKLHVADALVARQGITRLPGHEILLSILHPSEGAWGRHGATAPAWVKCYDHHAGLTPKGRSDDVEKFLAEFYGCPTGDEFFGTSDPEEMLVKKELTHWTRTPPGELPNGLGLPPATALYTDDGRSISNINDGGGQVGAIGQGTAATATTFTTASTYTTNQWTGYRVYVVSAAGTMVWGNIVSNTNAAGASVLTIDRWYAAATPGGSAASTPASFTGSNATFIIADGGMVATWFVGLATGANAAAHGDHTLSTNGNAEITTAGGGLIRKIAPYAQTSGVASRAITLTPVYTANGSDSLPATVTMIGVFASMVSSFGGAGGPMKFETALNVSATLSASGDQLTVTETVTGS